MEQLSKIYAKIEIRSIILIFAYMTETSFKCHRSTKSKIVFQEALKKFTFEGVIYQMVRHSKFLSSYTMFDCTFPAVVAQVSEQCVPSYFPTATV